MNMPSRLVTGTTVWAEIGAIRVRGAGSANGLWVNEAGHRKQIKYKYKLNRMFYLKPGAALFHNCAFHIKLSASKRRLILFQSCRVSVVKDTSLRVVHPSLHLRTSSGPTVRWRTRTCTEKEKHFDQGRQSCWKRLGSSWWYLGKHQRLLHWWYHKHRWLHQW